MPKKVLVVGSYSYYSPHASFGAYEGNVSVLEKKPDTIGLVVFIGGSDVDPSLYGEKPHPTTFASKSCDTRDLHAFKLAMKHSIPCAGICRGGQFLTVMAGGKLIQNVSGHSVMHGMVTKYGEDIMVTSSHHQMFGWPLPSKSVLIGWSREKYAKKAFEREKLYAGSSRALYRHFKSMAAYSDPNDDTDIVSLLSAKHASSAYEPDGVEPEYEPEVVYYPEINSLAAQYHPEMMTENSDGFKFYVEQVKKLLGNRDF